MSSSVAEFYANRCVLVTGFTGFLGKVLVEKLLRSCPDIKTIYVLVRPLNDKEFVLKDAYQRTAKILESVLFDKLRRECPKHLSKIIPINGDFGEDNLALSNDDKETLINNVTVVFHCAATVKFDEDLRLAVQLNVVGVQRLLKLCHEMKNIAALVHTSTAYANCNLKRIAEKIYPAPVRPEKLIASLEWMNDDMVRSLSYQLMESYNRPNTYTLTKTLAEELMLDESSNLPITIVRPSIICAVWREPLPGWIDNLNGPTGLMAAVGNGLLRSMAGNVDAKADIVPVDVVSNLLVVAAWHRATEKPTCCPVINCCSGRLNAVRWGNVEHSFKHFETYPLENIYRLPSPRFTTNRLWRDLNIWLDHMIPAYFVDACCRLIGKKPRLVRIYKRIVKAVDTLEYFTTREWDFQTKAMIEMWDDLSVEDRRLFNFDIRQVNWPQYLEMYVLGVKKFILKEDLSNLPSARKQYHRLQIWAAAINVAMGAVVFRVLIRRSKIFRQFWFYILSFAAAIWRLVPKIRIGGSSSPSSLTKSSSSTANGIVVDSDSKSVATNS